MKVRIDCRSFLSFSDNQPSREDLIWNANGGLTEKQIEQYLIVARFFILIDLFEKNKSVQIDLLEHLLVHWIVQQH